MEYTVNYNWKIKEQEDGTGLLHIIPVSGTLFQGESDIVIPKEAFEDIKNGEKNIFALMGKYNLHNLFIRWEKVIPNPKPNINTENCYQGTDFFVTHEEDKYYLSYLLSRQGGGERKMEISKEIYEDARRGEMNTSDIFKKYDLYKYDKD